MPNLSSIEARYLNFWTGTLSLINRLFPPKPSKSATVLYPSSWWHLLSMQFPVIIVEWQWIPAVSQVSQACLLTAPSSRPQTQEVRQGRASCVSRWHAMNFPMKSPYLDRPGRYISTGCITMAAQAEYLCGTNLPTYFCCIQWKLGSPAQNYGLWPMLRLFIPFLAIFDRFFVH